MRYDSKIGYHCNIACFISILLIEQKLQAPSPAMAFGHWYWAYRMSYLSNSFQVSSDQILACKLQWHRAWDTRRHSTGCQGKPCHHAIMPSCPTLSSDDDVSWWLGWVRMLMVTCSLQCDLTWLPVTRVCLATEGEQLSVGWWNVWPLSPAAAMGTGHTRGWGDLRRIADTVTSMQPGTSGHTKTTHPYFDIW